MKILLVRPDGIGDEILCLPVASELRRLRTGVKIAFLSSVQAAPVLEHHPDVDEILTVSGRERFRELVALFRSGFDAVLFLKPFRRLMLAAFIARVPERVATGYRWYSLLANRRVYEHRSDFTKHESEYNVGLLRGMNLKPGTPPGPTLVLTEAERQWGRARLEGMPAQRVVLHPGGLSSRRWKVEHYRRLLEKLTREGFAVTLTGSKIEGEYFHGTAPSGRGSGAGVLDLMGQLTVRQLMAVIAASHSVVSGSTGPAHIAAALGIPTVSLFDPRKNQLPTRWRPLGTGVVLRPDVPTCPKCIYEACPYWDCLDRISVEEVATQVGRAVAGPRNLAVVHV